MKNTHSDFRPINALEKRIFRDKEFLTAIRTGKSRKYHREGAIKNHITNILEYIDDKYKSVEEYENLRILAIIHDVGKFAFLEKYIDMYLPEMPVNKQKEFITVSKAFAIKYPVPKKIRQDMKEYIFTSQHAYVSYLYSKKFIKNKKMLDIIRYHDAASDFLRIFKDTGRYDIKKFKEIFSTIDIKLYLLFVDCDRCGRNNGVIPWMKKQLKSNKLV